MQVDLDLQNHTKNAPKTLPIKTCNSKVTAQKYEKIRVFCNLTAKIYEKIRVFCMREAQKAQKAPRTDLKPKITRKYVFFALQLHKYSRKHVFWGIYGACLDHIRA